MGRSVRVFRRLFECFHKPPFVFTTTFGLEFPDGSKKTSIFGGVGPKSATASANSDIDILAPRYLAAIYFRISSAKCLCGGDPPKT